MQMVTRKIQDQNSGDNSTNIQAETINISGINYSDARQIALDVYMQNIECLSTEAMDTALLRAEEFIDHFIERIISTNVVLLNELRFPGIQLLLFSAQKEYVKSGERFIDEMLINILSERFSQPERNLRQIATEAAVPIVSQLTAKQADILTVNLLVNDHWFMASNQNNLAHYLSLLSLFETNIGYHSPDISHIEFSGCAAIDPSSRYSPLKLLGNLVQSYPGLFYRGFTMDHFQTALDNSALYDDLLIPYSNDPGRMFQLNAMSPSDISRYLDAHGLARDDHKQLYDLQKTNLLSSDEQKKYLISMEPSIEFLFKPENSDLVNLQLRPVGVAIACANFMRKAGVPLAWPYRLRSAE